MLQFSGAASVVGGGFAAITDDFDRSDSALSLGSTSSGSLWTTRTGVLGISGNRGYPVSLTSGWAIATLDVGSADGCYQVKLPVARTQNTIAGLVLRYSDINNFFYAYYRLGLAEVLVGKVEAGVNTSNFATGAWGTDVSGNGQTLRVVLSGTSIKVYMEGVEVIDTTSSFNQTATKHGLWSAETVTRWDDLLFDDATPSAPAGGGTAWSAATTTGTLRNNFGGWVGARITVGASPITVQELGRVWLTGNTGLSTVAVVRKSDKAVMTTAVIDISSGVNDQYNWKAVDPVVLAAGTEYYIVNNVTSGGDQWRDLATMAAPNAAAALSGAVFSSDFVSFSESGSANQLFVPVNFKFT